jgi:hypothetical protein
LVVLTRKEFEGRLQAAGVVPTGVLSEDGLTQLWRKPDGNKVTVPIYDVLDKFLDHFKLANLPLYNSNQVYGDD